MAGACLNPGGCSPRRSSQRRLMTATAIKTAITSVMPLGAAAQDAAFTEEKRSRRADSNCRPAVYEVAFAHHENRIRRTFRPATYRRVPRVCAPTAARIAARAY
jgi:hypothetical protein